jgi:outer membrane protein OmpA-like peptidoglycan-associated protein
MRNLLFCLTILINNLCFAQSAVIMPPQVPVFFNIGSYALTPAAKHTLDSLLYADAIPPNRIISVVGYADVLGDEEINKTLSQNRSNAVAAYLSKMGVDSAQIEKISGEGEIARAETETGYAKDRRVTIFLGDTRQKDKIEWSEDGTLIGTIYFKYKTVSIIPKSGKMLDSLVSVLKANSKMKIHVNGYVCCYNYDGLGMKQYNTLKSTRYTDTARINGATRICDKRTQTISAYLIGKGIPAGRIKQQSFGYLKNKKLPNGDDVHGHDRVEIRGVLE